MPEESNQKLLDDLQKKLQEVEGQRGRVDVAAIPILDQLAYCNHVKGNYDAAEQHYLHTLSLRETLTPEDFEGRLFVLHSLGVLSRVRNRYEDSERHYMRALELTRKKFGDSHPQTATRLNYLAGLYFAMGAYGKAEDLVRQSLEIYRNSVGEEHHVVGTTSLALALILRRQGKTKDADEMFKRADRLIPNMHRGLGENDLSQIAGNLLSLSRDKYRMGRYDESETLFRHSRLIETQEIWPGHPLVAESVHLLGDLFRSQHLLSEAEQLYRFALTMRRQVLGGDHLDCAVSAHSLGTLLHDNRRFEESEPFLKEAIEIRSKSGFPPLLANSMRAYAAVLRSLNKVDEANQYYKKAEEIWDNYNPTKAAKS